MLTKKDLPVINTAYYCSTGARLAPPHPSPVNIYQVASLLARASAKNIENAFNGSNALIMQAIQTLPGLNSAPWINGCMSKMSLHPLILQFYHLAYQHGMGYKAFDPSSVIRMIEELQFCMQTSHYGNSLEKWMGAFDLSKQTLNTTFRALDKNVSGFELQEFSINCDATQNGSLQIKEFKTLVSNEMKKLLNLAEPDKCLAIFLKQEPCLNHRMNMRYIVILQKDFIDEPAGFADLSFFENLKKTVESNSCYVITYDFGYLNGFLVNNRFSKKSPNYRERIRCLKTYLIGTDTLYRLNGLQPSCEVVYSKFD